MANINEKDIVLQRVDVNFENGEIEAAMASGYSRDVNGERIRDFTVDILDNLSNASKTSIKQKAMIALKKAAKIS